MSRRRWIGSSLLLDPRRDGTGTDRPRLVVSGESNRLVCHITNNLTDAESNTCQAVVISVSPNAERAHVRHGDLPAPAGSRPGDTFNAPCP